MGTNRIEVATLDGRLRTMLIWQRLEKPRDIVVNPMEGLMFWCQWGSKPLIEVAGMDGSNRLTLVSTHIHFPNGLVCVADFSIDFLLFFLQKKVRKSSISFVALLFRQSIMRATGCILSTREQKQWNR